MQRTIFACLLVILCNLSLIRTDDSNKSNVPLIKVSSSNIYLEEQFQQKSTWSQWIRSEARKDGVDENIAKYDGEWAFERPQSSVYRDDYALIMKSKARHYAISRTLDKPFDFTKADRLIVQYEVKFQTSQECGGAYVKLLVQDDNEIDLQQVTDKTPYTIMFGPDKCGADAKYHLIIRYQNPQTGHFTEHQAKKSTEPLETYFNDQKTHLYTLVLSSDNKFEMFIDNKLINSGNLLDNFEPSIVPPKEIVDENDRKPAEWDENEKIVDTKAKKPDDWNENAPKEIVDPLATKPTDWLENEPLTVPDPDATKPTDWDDEMDGSWEAPLVDNPRCRSSSGCGKWTPPLVPNPAYKGKWSPPMIDNPNYRGQWEPRKIPNPNYFEVTNPYRLKTIGTLTLELWSMVEGVVFDNFLITSDRSIAKEFADQLWSSKSKLEQPSSSSSTPSTDTNSWASFFNNIQEEIQKQPWILVVSVIAGLASAGIAFFYYFRRESPKKKLAKDAKNKSPTENSTSTEDEEIEIDDDDDEEEVKPKEKRKTSPKSRARRRTRKE